MQYALLAYGSQRTHAGPVEDGHRRAEAGQTVVKVVVVPGRMVNFVTR